MVVQANGTHRANGGSKAPLYAVPIPDRHEPPRWGTAALVILFMLVGCILPHTSQYLVLPLALLPVTRPWHELASYPFKRFFGCMLVSICYLFGPIKIVLTFTDEEGNALDPEQFVVRDPSDRRRDGKGEVQKLKMPDRSVWISNHQIYTDWIYLWVLAYYADLAGCITILMKASLKNIPIFGWAMQFYRFIFLKQNWAADRMPLAKQLAALVQRARDAGRHAAASRVASAKKRDDGDASDSTGDDKLKAFRKGPLPPPSLAGSLSAHLSKVLLLIFPEGTLVSALTRPKSKAFAEKAGIPDLKNMLLPRSTGLLFCLRTMAAEIDDLYLVDYTIGYPGVPPAGYGQSYYTLRTVFVQGVPPPAVHMNCILTKVPSRADGAVTDASSPSKPPLGVLPPSARASGEEAHQPSEEEKQAFDLWLRRRYELKDKLMTRFYQDGDFVRGSYKESAGRSERATAQIEDLDTQYVELPTRLRGFGDALWTLAVCLSVFPLALAYRWLYAAVSRALSN